LTQQYLRQLSLIVADPAGKGIEIGALRVVFQIIRGDLQTPNSCDCKIYNLSDDTAKRIYSPEFTQLQLLVGYQDQQLQLIFRGSIKQVRKGREDQKNTYVAITAADGDESYNFSVVALTLAAGSTQAQGIASLIQAMATRALANNPTGGNSGSQPITQGYTPELSANRSVRGRTFYGLCRDELRQLAQSNDCTWSIQDGAVTLIPQAGYIPAPPILITPATGLIGVPEQTQNGLEITVLLNPSIKIGQRVQLQADINQLRLGLDSKSILTNYQLALSQTKLDAQGMYYVLRAEHFGDTRGNPWYTKLTCLAVNADFPSINAPSAAIFPGDLIPRY
jgi:hypothetical protein